MQTDNSHAGHRQRLKNLFESEGMVSLTDARALEMLLFYVIPRSDTYPTAVKLLETFGSLRGVLTASKEEIKAVKGIGDGTAMYLGFISSLIGRIEEEDMLSYCGYDEIRFASPKELCSYYLEKLSNCRTEQMWLSCFDDKLRLKKGLLLGEGDETKVLLEPNAVIDSVKDAGCSICAIGHNHPLEQSVPSEEDRASTLKLKSILKDSGITLLDHIVVGTDGARAIISGEMVHMLR